jgi:uncharacterized protein (TIGR03067 family)
MTRHAAALAFLAAALTGLTHADDKTVTELEGTYKLVSAEQNGKLAAQVLIDTITVHIKGDELIVATSPDEKKTAKIKLMPDAKLSTIDITPTEGDVKNKTFPGIYKLEKGELTIAYSEKGDRPKEFKSENEAILLKMKKVAKDKK